MRSLVAVLAILLTLGFGSEGKALADPPQPAGDHAPAQEQHVLAVGDKAPPLTVEKWVKGGPVASCEKGKVYVIDFWATWCGPCVKDIARLTELQKKYKDVTFIGVSIAEKNGLQDLELFVQKSGHNIGYAVAFDNGRTDGAWREAAGFITIPTAFVVTGDQRIAWMGGNLDKLEEVLAQVAAGKFDIEKAAAEAKKNGGGPKFVQGMDPKTIVLTNSGEFKIEYPGGAGMGGLISRDKSTAGEKQKAQDPPKLKIGDAAPALSIEKWVKGEPVTSFEKNKVYVVEFWATWCGPCRQSIPHLTEMQKKHKNVKFIGISSDEQHGLADVEPFVQKMGDKMDYTVAFDKDHATNKAWMAWQAGIPTAFVVVDQKIAWMGHPMAGLEEVVDQAAVGKYDSNTIAAKAKHEAEMQAKVEAIVVKVQAALQATPPDYAKASDLFDEAIAINPAGLGNLVVGKIRLLGVSMKQPEKAYAYANEALTTSLKDNAQALNEVAWNFLSDEAFAAKRDPATAKKLAERANELTQGKDAGILDTLAAACMQTGDVERALQLQTKAVELAPEGEVKQELQKRLDEYTKKAKKA